MPAIDVAPGSPYRHLRLTVPPTPGRTRWSRVLAGGIVAAALTQAPRLVPTSVAHPVDARGTPVALHVLHFDDDEVEPLRGIVAFAPSLDGAALAVRADGRAFRLDDAAESVRRVAFVEARTSPEPWHDGPTEIDGVAAVRGEMACLRLVDGSRTCTPGSAHDPRARFEALCADDPSCGWSAARCRRTDDGRVECRGGLADGRVIRRQRPRPIASALRFTQIAAYDRRTCGVTTGGEVACWGPAVTVVPGLPPAAAVLLRDAETCVIARDGAVWCWNPTVADDRAQRKELPMAAATLAMNRAATCALTGVGAVWCWGTIGRAWPGHPRAMRAARPLDVRLPDAALSLYAPSEDAMCARLRSGETRCWGGTEDHWAMNRPIGALGDTPSDDTWPAPPGATAPERRAWRLDDGRVAVRDPRFLREMAVLGDLPPARQVVDGREHSCALARDGVAWCWDGNEYGQLGLDDAVAADEWRVVMIARPSRSGS